HHLDAAQDLLGRPARVLLLQRKLKVIEHRQQKDAGGTAEQILGGVEMVKAELLRALEMQGVTPIQPEAGDELNPGAHEAVSQMPTEGVEPGRIAQVFQVGYMLGERVLRPAKVLVASEPPADAPDAEG
ncbi:MAG: nucleotide exchange factor GrpE, partial [Planctomycetota bacterium]